MRKWDSSITRVRPLFQALIGRDLPVPAGCLACCGWRRRIDHMLPGWPAIWAACCPKSCRPYPIRIGC